MALAQITAPSTSNALVRLLRPLLLPHQLYLSKTLPLALPLRHQPTLQPQQLIQYNNQSRYPQPFIGVRTFWYGLFFFASFLDPFS
jgi:hypothetical protein